MRGWVLCSWLLVVGWGVQPLAQLQYIQRQHPPALPSTTSDEQNKTITMVDVIVAQALSAYWGDEHDTPLTDTLHHLSQAPKQQERLDVKGQLKSQAIYALRRLVWGIQYSDGALVGWGLVGLPVGALWGAGVGTLLFDAGSGTSAIATLGAKLGTLVVTAGSGILGLVTPMAADACGDKWCIRAQEWMLGIKPKKPEETIFWNDLYAPANWRLKRQHSVLYNIDIEHQGSLINDSFRIHFFRHKPPERDSICEPCAYDTKNETTLFQYSIDGFETLTHLNGKYLSGRLVLKKEGDEYVLVHKTYQSRSHNSKHAKFTLASSKGNDQMLKVNRARRLKQLLSAPVPQRLVSCPQLLQSST